MKLSSCDEDDIQTRSVYTSFENSKQSSEILAISWMKNFLKLEKLKKNILIVHDTQADLWFN